MPDTRVGSDRRDDRMTNVLGALLDAAAPSVTTADAEQLARVQFGLDARATTIGGERDRNFHLVCRDGRQVVLKIIHPAEPAAVTDLQSRLLLHLQDKAIDLQVPRLLRPLHRDDLEYPLCVDGQPPRRVRCVSYLAGRSLHQTVSTAAQRRHLGASLARIDRALSDFRHQAETHDLVWDLKAVARVRPLLTALQDAEKRERAEAVLDRFAAFVAPALSHVRHQTIHNDFNPHNVLVDLHADDVVTGVIDFGDAVRSPLVQDLAVAAAYQLGTTGHPLQGAADLAVGFHAVCPLDPLEIELLPDMIAARLALSMAISSWRATRHPDNAAYLLRNQSGGLTALQRLQGLPRDAAIDWLRRQTAIG